MPLVTSDPSAYDVVRLASRAVLTDDRAADLRAAGERVESWRDVLLVAAHHRVLPLLYAHLQPWAPQNVQDELHNYVRGRAMSVLFLNAEMARIARSFDGAGVRFLTFKGPALAEAYGGTARRPFVDNDLLIDPADFDTAARLLGELGFQTRPRSPLQRAGYLRVNGEYTFGRAAGPLISTVDLHTRLVPVGYPYHGPFDALYRRSRTLHLAGEDVPTFAWDDLYLALAVNALKDQWNRLRLATDLAETARFVPDWAALEDRARRTRCLRALHMAVLVSADAVGAEYPARVLAAARADARAARLADRVLRRLPLAHAEPVMEGRDRIRFTLLAPDGVRGQLQYLAYVGLRRVMEPLVSVDGDTA